MKIIDYGKHDVDENDIESVVKVLRSNFLTQGPAVPQFELDLVGFCGAHDAVAVNSATSALHIACLALGLGPGDILWTSPITFVASANCGMYCGASIDFVDVDNSTGNMCIEALKEKLERARETNRLPKILIPVHFTGRPCRMAEIFKLSKQYGFRIIEDASHALGASYSDGSLVGCSKYSDVTVFSFHPVKMITTAEGGAALTNNKKIAQDMRLYRSHGITRDQEAMISPSSSPWYYEQLDLGYNYRMSDIQAALGSSQIKKLRKFVLSRRKIAHYFNSHLKSPLIILPKYSDYSSWHLYVVQLKLESISKNYDEVFNELRKKGIGVNRHYIPVHFHPYYRKKDFSHGDFPNAENFFQRSITLPLHTKLGIEDLDYIISMLEQVVR